MSNLEKYQSKWLKTWHKLSDPHGKPYKDEYDAAQTFSILRNDKDAIRACLKDFPHGEAIADRIIEIIDATAWGPENPQPCQSMYFLVQNPYPATDEELTEWVTHLLERINKITGGVEQMPTIEVVRCDDMKEVSPDYDWWDDLITDLNDTLGDNAIDKLDEETKAGYYLIDEPLYMMACYYELAHFVEWAFIADIVRGTNPYRPLFNLWRSGAELGHCEPNHVKIFAPKLDREITIPPPLPPEKLVTIAPPDEEWRTQPTCNVPQLNGFEFYTMKRDLMDGEAVWIVETNRDRNYGRLGLKLDDWNSIKPFTVDREFKADFIWSTSFLPFVSDNFKGIMEAEQVTGVDYHPVKLIHKSGEAIAGYWFMNILGIRDAIDRSQHPTYTEYLWSIEKYSEQVAEYTIQKEVVKNADLFRALEEPEDVPVPWYISIFKGKGKPTPRYRFNDIFTSSRFRDLCIKHNATGSYFRAAIAT